MAACAEMPGVPCGAWESTLSGAAGSSPTPGVSLYSGASNIVVYLGFGERGMGVGRNEYTSPFKVDHIGFFS